MTNIIKANTAIKLAVVLIDALDFKTEEIGIAYTAVTVRYRSPASETSWQTKTVGSEDWAELGHGMYLISFTAGEIGAISGEFLYYCEATGCLPYYGSALVQQNLLDDIAKILSNRWKIINNQFIIYEDDDETPYLTFDLKNADGQPAETGVKERVPV